MQSGPSLVADEVIDDGYVSPTFDLESASSQEEHRPSKRFKRAETKNATSLEDDEELALALLRKGLGGKSVQQR
jgi:hypothetical protein